MRSQNFSLNRLGVVNVRTFIVMMMVIVVVVMCVDISFITVTDCRIINGCS